MRRVMIGFVLGFLVAAAAACTIARWDMEGPTVLFVWRGEGARPGVYALWENPNALSSQMVFFDCRRLNTGVVPTPASRP